jgi:hypothetical protein
MMSFMTMGAVKAILYEYASVCPTSSPRTFCSSDASHNFFLILIIKPTRCEIFKFIFLIEIYMFRTGSLSIVRSLALYTAIGIYHTGFSDYLI